MVAGCHMAIILQHQHCAELQVQQHETCGWGCSCAPQQLDVACAMCVYCDMSAVLAVRLQYFRRQQPAELASCGRAYALLIACAQHLCPALPSMLSCRSGFRCFSRFLSLPSAV